MSIVSVQAPDHTSVVQAGERIDRVSIFLSQRLVSEAISSLITGGPSEIRVVCDSSVLKTPDRVEFVGSATDRDVFVLDMETVRRLESKPGFDEMLRSTILLTCPDELMLHGIYRKNIRALVSWDCSSSTLRHALVAVTTGLAYIDPLLVRTLEQIVNIGRTILTNRQMQILQMVAAGDCSREIANKLRLSRRTVENHRARILERLGVNSASEMIDIARQNNWI